VEKVRALAAAVAIKLVIYARALQMLAGAAPRECALLVAILPLGFAHTYRQLRSWRTILQQGPLTRAMRYFASVPTTAAHAKEVRLFGLGPHFERRSTACRPNSTIRPDRLSRAPTSSG
jgi:hypothetical protein